MTVNTGVKGTLAKLLATEDLIIEHKRCETASFDVERRVLSLPVWEKASGEVYDLLVSHEVGHALYTPKGWDNLDCPQSFLNVTEDARVEKLMKRRYPGLPKTFYRGYKELNDDDFFSVRGNLEKMNLIDRINLQFKVGPFISIDFSEEEKEFVKLVSDAETFEEAVDAANKIYAFMKEQLDKKEEMIQPPSQQGGGETPQDTQKTEAPSDDPGTSEGDTDADGDESDTESTPDVDVNGGLVNDPLESQTDKSLAEKLKGLITDQYDTEYIEVPRHNVDELVVAWKDYLNAAEQCFVYQEDRHWINHDLDQSVKDYQEFRDKSKKEVQYLIKEFECRKAADTYNRSGSARTGVLDTAKLHTYKYNEDLFKRVTVLPEGKNHGMVFLLDWSGSMGNCIIDTVKQVLQLSWFCRKTNIPFDVYTFGHNWNCFYGDREFDEIPGRIAFTHGFSLTQVLTSSCNNKEFERLALSLWRNAGAVGSIPGTWTRMYNFGHSTGMSLGGTPLLDSIAAMHSVLPEFIKRTRSQKVSLTILTDGESGPATIYSQSHYLGSRVYTTCFGRRCQLRDRKTGRIYPKYEDACEQLSSFIENLKDRFPTVNILGFRLVNSRDTRAYFRFIGCLGYLKGSNNEECVSKFRKQRFFEVSNSPYDKLWVMPTSLVENTDSLDQLDEDASTAQIRSAFKKMYKGRSQNKKMLTSFAQTVA